jgi:hypothetical protein
MSIKAWYFGNPYCCVFSCIYKKVKQIIKSYYVYIRTRNKKQKQKENVFNSV